MRGQVPGRVEKGVVLSFFGGVSFFCFLLGVRVKGGKEWAQDEGCVGRSRVASKRGGGGGRFIFFFREKQRHGGPKQAEKGPKTVLAWAGWAGLGWAGLGWAWQPQTSRTKNRTNRPIWQSFGRTGLGTKNQAPEPPPHNRKTQRHGGPKQAKNGPKTKHSCGRERCV